TPSNIPRTPVKYPSTSHLPTISSNRLSLHDEMSTLPDPRNRPSASDSEDGDSSPRHHPDLSDEVATLSTKLISAINHQTFLDDTLSATRHELESAQKRNKELEEQVASQREMLAGDVWVRRSVVEAEKRAIQALVAEEKLKRLDTEKEKKKIEQELESLSTALFEEANKMVVRAKEEAQAEQDLIQRKNDQLRAQLADSESLLKSQQEQLSELKQVMENMATEQEEQAQTSVPSSPGLSRHDTTADDDNVDNDGAVTSPTVESVPAAHPTSFQYLIQPVLRTDIAAYSDFVTLARISRKRSGSRVSSGSMGGLNALSLALGGSTSSAHPSNASSTSLANSPGGGPSASSAPHSPNTPASTVSVGSASGIPLPALRETRFFKRVLAEDVEPTLRLDVAPGLSWLNRRSVTNAVADGTLVVEPVPTNTPIFAIAKPQFSPCSLCGESRKDALYLRNHRFRISETDSAQRYPLCRYCLARVRSTCEFLGFLRMVKDGHWRADDEDHEKAAWEESVRLREQMFWSRIGGGVVPVVHTAVPSEASRSPRPSTDNNRLGNDLVVPMEPIQETKQLEVKQKTVPSSDSALEESAEDGLVTKVPQTPPQQTETSGSPRNSAQSLDSKSSPESDGNQRLSITIPPSE
ncbi:hypothetical protein B0I35DRAFT_359938, partial [Stachybotrys elegans]